MDESWELISDIICPNEQVAIFERIVQNKIEAIFPKKCVKLSVNYDKPFITADLKKLDRQRNREYLKHHRSDKYEELKRKYEEKFKSAAVEHLEKNVRSLKQAYEKAYASLKKMAQPGDCSNDGSFVLSSHVEGNPPK